MLNSPLRQTAESVCMCVSWALTLFFSLSWRQLPWGSSLHGSTREALESGLYTLHSLYMFAFVTTWSICYQELRLHIEGLLLSLSLCLVFILLLWRDPNSQLSPPDAGSWFGKKQGQTQSTVASMCMYRIQQYTPNKQLSTTPQQSSAGDTSVSPLSPLSLIHLQVYLIQVAAL